MYHSCFIYGTWRSKEVGGLKSSYGGKLRGAGATYKVREGRAIFMGQLTPQSAIPSELPTYFGLFWCKKSSMIYTT